jgi:hypothetical protein
LPESRWAVYIAAAKESMGKSKLSRCVKCHLTPSGVLTKILHGKGPSLAKKYFVLCGCQELVLFDSKVKAASAWNKANNAAQF